MVPAIKVYKMDYSFIIKNYLNPKLWQKTWTLFEYKDFVITLRLSKINTISNAVTFDIILNDNSENCRRDKDTNEVDFYLNNGTIEMLIKRINGTILRSISYHERYHVFEMLDTYKNALQVGEDEEKKLKSIANEFLDGEGITNEEIRKLYIDDFVSNNKKNYEYVQTLRNAFEYHLLTDLYLVFLKSIDDEEKYQEVLNALEESEMNNVLKEINKYKQIIETEEYETEMKGLLETI